jgi:hypothetical protein
VVCDSDVDEPVAGNNHVGAIIGGGFGGGGRGTKPRRKGMS